MFAISVSGTEFEQRLVSFKLLRGMFFLLFLLFMASGVRAGASRSWVQKVRRGGEGELKDGDVSEGVFAWKRVY